MKHTPIDAVMDHFTVFMYKLSRRRLPEGLTDDHHSINVDAWERLRKDGKAIRDGFIESQNALSEMRFGRPGAIFRKAVLKDQIFTGAYNTCSVISIYNTLMALGLPASLPDIIRETEEKGLPFGAELGMPGSFPYKYFKNKGIDTGRLKAGQIKREAVDAFEKEYDAFIFTAFNHRLKPGKSVHFMSITRDGDIFRIHNGKAPKVPAKTLWDAIDTYNDGRGHAFYLTGIRKREDNR